MTLRNRMVLTIVVALIGFVATLYVITSTILLEGCLAQAGVNYLLLTILAIAVVAGLVFTFFLERYILSRLVQLSAQERLYENLVAVARATAERPTLEATLQNALDVAYTLTGAEHGSLFLLDNSGKVIRSVFAKDQLLSDQRKFVIGQVMDKGLAGWVVQRRQAVLIADVMQDERWLSLPDQPYSVRSVLVVPILSGTAPVGLITLIHSQPDYFKPEHLSMMRTSADQMALALRNAQMFDEQRRQASRQTTLYEVLRAISGQLDPDSIAQVAVDAIVKYAGWPHLAVILPSGDGQQWVVCAASGILAGVAATRLPMEDGVIGRTFRTGQTQYVPDVRLDLNYVSAHPDIRSEVSVPIRHSEQVLGVLNLEGERPDAFSSEDILLAESLAEAIALALSSARLYVETRKYATDMSAIYAVTRAISQSLTLEEVLSHALPLAISMLDFEAGFIALADALNEQAQGKPDSSRLRLMTESGLPPAYAEHLQRAGLTGSLGGYVYEIGENLIIGDLERDASSPAAPTAELTTSGWCAYAGIPLSHQEQPMGVLCLFARQARMPSAYNLALLTTVGHQVATAVTNIRLLQTALSERSRLQALIKSSRDGVVLIGLDRRILVLNAPALHMLGLPGQVEDWLGRPVRHALKLLQPYAVNLVKSVLAEMRRLRRGDTAPTEGEYDMSSRTVHWINLPVRAGALPLGRLVVLRDVTDERALEHLRDDMTHTMVHDLRSPLSAIFSTSELMAMNAGALSPELGLMIEMVRKNTRKMLTLVNSILDVNRLESGRMPINPEPIVLADLVGDVLHLQTALAEEKNLRLENAVSPDLPAAWADPDLIRRMLENLVSNAIKFTPAGGHICITARLEAERAGAHLLVSVSDSGPGIPPEIESRLFQKFVTGPQKGRGSGLGLALCRLAIEAHGEHIWVEGAPGGGAPGGGKAKTGTTFTFSLATHSPANGEQNT